MIDPNDPWERIRHMTLDQLVTQTKLAGSALGVQGFTTPEGWPFFIIVGVASPGNEALLDYAIEFHANVSADASWAAYAKREK